MISMLYARTSNSEANSWNLRAFPGLKFKEYKLRTYSIYILIAFMAVQNCTA